MHLFTLDLVVLCTYLVIMLAIGIWNRKQSARNLESYFLAGKTTPWWMLGLSGSVSNFDIAGTMWLVGMVFTLFTAVFVAIGIVIGSLNQSIEEIWKWMQLALLPSILIPNMLRWYWWRMNGWGFTIGAFTGAILALGKLILGIDLPELIYFPAFNLIILVASVVGSLCTPPVEEATLVAFYRRVHPRGLWAPIRKASRLSSVELDGQHGLERPWNIILNIVVGTVGLYAVFVFPLYAIGHWGLEALLAGLVAIAAGLILYFTWYRNLPTDA